jgi:hypothetical protein
VVRPPAIAFVISSFTEMKVAVAVAMKHGEVAEAHHE